MRVRGRSRNFSFDERRKLSATDGLGAKRAIYTQVHARKLITYTGTFVFGH